MNNSKQSKKQLKPISLHPLKLDDAVSGIMQFNPNSVEKDDKEKNEKKKKEHSK